MCLRLHYRGTYDIYVQINGVDTNVGNYNNKGSFGELALMYNMPRAATIIATSEGSLWAMVSLCEPSLHPIRGCFLYCFLCLCTLYSTVYGTTRPVRPNVIPYPTLSRYRFLLFQPRFVKYIIRHLFVPIIHLPFCIKIKPSLTSTY